MSITKDTVIGEILDFNGKAAAPLFMDLGMHCLGCPMSRGETVEQACAVHGANPDELVGRLNQAVNAA